MTLPIFRYHPDPIQTGSIQVSNTVCIVCRQLRGYIYASHAYSVREYVDCICPWCIADGTAHEKLGVEFFGSVGVGGGGRWDAVAPRIIDEIVCRTPGFSGWQQEQWFTHCGDAAAFLGRVGFQELASYGADAVQCICASTSLLDGSDEWQAFFESLDKDGSPTAYLFRCLHCGVFGGYTDCD